MCQRLFRYGSTQGCDRRNEDCLDTTGAGSGGTRNISGTTHYHVALEMEVARWHKKESALIHTSAFVANEWTLISLTKIIDDIEFVSDDNNHLILVQGILKSKAPKHLSNQTQ